MVSAEEVYVDPSALTRLYLHQKGSREISAWRTRVKGAFPVTHHGRVEIITAVALAVFRGEKTIEEGEYSWRWIEEDFREGNLLQVDILWRAALNRAADLGREHTPRLGTRALDVLHVGCALELGLRKFFTFDARQKKLAEAVGLKVVEIEI